MSRSPFLPALIAFLFSSLFSFATSAFEGEWERLDGGARLRLKLDRGGRINGTLTGAHAQPVIKLNKRRLSTSGRLPLPNLRRWLRRITPGSQRGAGIVYECATRRHRLGRAHLASSDRLILNHSRSSQKSEWRRIS